MEKFVTECQKCKIQHTFLHTCNNQKIIYEISYTPVIRLNVSFSMDGNDLNVSVTSKFLHSEVSYNLQKYGEKLILDLKGEASPFKITSEIVKFAQKYSLSL